MNQEFWTLTIDPVARPLNVFWEDLVKKKWPRYNGTTLYLHFYTINIQWEGMCNWNPSSWKTRTRLSLIINTMVVGGMWRIEPGHRHPWYWPCFPAFYFCLIISGYIHPCIMFQVASWNLVKTMDFLIFYVTRTAQTLVTDSWNPDGRPMNLIWYSQFVSKILLHSNSADHPTWLLQRSQWVNEEVLNGAISSNLTADRSYLWSSV